MKRDGKTVWRYILFDVPGADWYVNNGMDYFRFRVEFTSYELKGIANSKITGEFSLEFKCLGNDNNVAKIAVLQDRQSLLSKTVEGGEGAFPPAK